MANANGRETEAKFQVSDLRKIETRLLELEARLIQPRVHESNLRFDMGNNELHGASKVLRLRQDDKVRLTYKGPSSEGERGVVSRVEIEFEVGDYESAKQFLEALGFHIYYFYEKFRSTYELNGVHVMLDELPYGTFIEIEGEDIDEIHNVANLLGLKWEAMIKAGYHSLYDRISEKYGLRNAQLSFEEFKNTKVDIADMDVVAADE